MMAQTAPRSRAATLAGSLARSGPARGKPRRRLKIFVGAAPGVGKTYEMLQSARAKVKDGYDVVVGVVETHGRQGDGSAARRARNHPAQAHRVQGSDARGDGPRRADRAPSADRAGRRTRPHQRARQPASEALSRRRGAARPRHRRLHAVNIQHIESLNDVVAQITHVRVRETVPDSVFDRADAIELVDLTPDDLIQRLKEGKVYVPKQAERALEHYFSPGNLTALRELALRRTAERVDEQLLTQMQANAMRGLGRRRAHPGLHQRGSARGRARPLHQAAGGPAARALDRASSIETRRSLQLSDEQRDRLADTLRLAEALGGEAMTIPGVGRRIADDVLGFAQANNMTQIIIGKSMRSLVVRNPARLGGARPGAARRQYQRARHRRRRTCGEPIPKKTVRDGRTAPSRSIRVPMLIALLVVAVALGVGELIQPLLGIENVDLVFLTAVVGVAVRYGLLPSLLASVAASLCYNFFFLPPLYTFTITDPTNVAAFFFFMLIAILVSNVAARGAHPGRHRVGRVRTTESLYAFSRKLAGVGDARRRAVGDRLSDRADAEGAGGAAAAGGRLDRREGGLSAGGSTRRCRSRRRQLGVGATIAPAGRGSDTLPGAKRLFLPMRTGRGPIGVIGIDERQDRAAADAGPAPAARRADGSGRARDRARAAGRGHGSRQAHRRDRPVAIGAA